MRHCRQPLTERRHFLAGLGAAGLLSALAACSRASGAPGSGESQAEPLAPKAPLLAPAALSARLADVQSGKIAVLQVGPKYLWGKSHIPGSRWIGEAGEGDGLAALQAALEALPIETEVVAYCGCCPVSHCPNLGPARRALAGRTKASFLDLPTNFRTDWIDKGFPVERG